MHRKNIVYVGLVLSEVSGIGWGSWNVSPADKGEPLYFIHKSQNVVLRPTQVQFYHLYPRTRNPKYLEIMWGAPMTFITLTSLNQCDQQAISMLIALKAASHPQESLSLFPTAARHFSGTHLCFSGPSLAAVRPGESASSGYEGQCSHTALRIRSEINGCYQECSESVRCKEQSLF